MRGLLAMIDKRVCVGSAAVCIVFIVWAMTSPVRAGAVLNAVLDVLTTNFGWLYLGAVFFFVAFPFMFVIFGTIASFVRALSDDTIAPVEWIFDENPADDVHAVLRLPGAASGSGGNP